MEKMLAVFVMAQFFCLTSSGFGEFLFSRTEHMTNRKNTFLWKLWTHGSISPNTGEFSKRNLFPLSLK